MMHAGPYDGLWVCYWRKKSFVFFLVYTLLFALLHTTSPSNGGCLDRPMPDLVFIVQGNGREAPVLMASHTTKQLFELHEIHAIEVVSTDEDMIVVWGRCHDHGDL